MTKQGPFNLNTTFVHLEADRSAKPINVTSYTFSEDWNAWEMHPHGEELVCLLSGAVDFMLAQDGTHRTIELRSNGSLVLVPRGVWHTAKARAPSSMMFITPGEDTEYRPLDNGA